MSPEDIKPEWVEKAARIFHDMTWTPGGGRPYDDRPLTVRAAYDEKARHALAAVLPEAMAEAWDEGEEAGLENAMYVGWEHLQTPNPYREGSPS
jgi:hypothetical protein